mgnify:CR=1 FL=1
MSRAELGRVGCGLRRRESSSGGQTRYSVWESIIFVAMWQLQLLSSRSSFPHETGNTIGEWCRLRELHLCLAEQGMLARHNTDFDRPS